ncbi:MAG: hypothetical protein SPK79_03355 [Erysipelotrichaceae bacterium]|nr:hypothetical protein [Erysipelotrichaceae bacterium]
MSFGRYIFIFSCIKFLFSSRSLYTASQSVVSEQYAINSAFEQSTGYFEDSGMNAEIIALSEVDGEYECYIALDSVYSVSELFYKENDKSVYLKDGSFRVVEDMSKPAGTNIAIKTTQIQVPGSYYTELANSGFYQNPSDIALLSSVEDMQRKAISIYQQERLSGPYGFIVKFINGLPEIVSYSQDIQTRVRNSGDVVIYGYFYVIAVEDNKIGTCIDINEETRKISIRESRIRIDRNNYDYYGFDMKEYK